MDMLVKDLDKEMTVSTAEEKDAQADYEQFKTASKAEASKELGALLEYIASLHAECDWLLKFYDMRKTARASEIDALGQAKAVLSGADYSLVQTASKATVRKHLRAAA